MKHIRPFIAGAILTACLIFTFHAEAGIAGFKTDFLTAVQNNFTAGDRARIADAFASEYGYQATINGSPNPQTKADFAADRVCDFIRSVVKNRESRVDVAAVPTPTPLTP